MTQENWSPSGTRKPAGSVRNNSPGVRPSWHTERASGPGAPKPCTNTHASTFSAMIPTVTTGRRTVGIIALNVLRSEEHTSELQSLAYLVCRLLLEKKEK